MVGAVEVERRRLLLYIFGSRLAEVVGKKPALLEASKKKNVNQPRVFGKQEKFGHFQYTTGNSKIYTHTDTL